LNGENIAYIGAGSNTGDGLANCRGGIAALGRQPLVTVDECSRFYRTAPMEYADQPWFTNAVFRIQTPASPPALLKILKSVEQDAGRERSDIRFGPRVLDFDVILFNDDIIDTPDLIVPHPRMHQREFVLRPLCDLSPDLVHPVLKTTMRRLLEDAVSPQYPCIPIPGAAC
jgi:2-amino-4-hydroxy-6-hydroxymethyldihydropteridine diphosphokinase